MDALKTLCIFLVIATICTQLVSNKGFYKYVKLLVGLMMLSIALSSIRDFLNKSEDLTEQNDKWNRFWYMEQQIDCVEKEQLVNSFMQNASEMFEEVERENATEVKTDATE